MGCLRNVFRFPVKLALGTVSLSTPTMHASLANQHSHHHSPSFAINSAHTFNTYLQRVANSVRMQMLCYCLSRPPLQTRDPSLQKASLASIRRTMERSHQLSPFFHRIRPAHKQLEPRNLPSQTLFLSDLQEYEASDGVQPIFSSYLALLGQASSRSLVLSNNLPAA